jgi:thioester reductase-like protein
MAKILLTGFPGFLGSALLPRILAPRSEAEAVCLVQSRFADLARTRRDELCHHHPQLANRIHLVEGDICEPGLGLGPKADISPEITEIFHLAAVYDLMVERDLAMKVNVEGTRRVLAFAEQCSRLHRLHYVSTCYVSGRWAGIFTEEDLDLGQRFNNFYEETKFLAEVEVQTWRDQGLPTTVYRPSIVVGDSRTGATQKYDGPYFVIRWLLRQPWLALLPVVGDPSAVRVNLVPRDFVIDALAYLSGLERSLGRVYQLADPNPLTVEQLLAEIETATGKKVLQIPVLLGPTKMALDHLPGAFRLVQIPSAAIDYFVQPTHYTTHNTLEDLEGSEIRVPPVSSYLGRLVEFVRRNPTGDLGVLT